MTTSIIKRDADYETALREIERLFEVDDKAFDLKQIESLLNFIETYEDKHYPIPKPNLVHRISYYLVSRGFLHR